MLTYVCMHTDIDQYTVEVRYHNLQFFDFGKLLINVCEAFASRTPWTRYEIDQRPLETLCAEVQFCPQSLHGPKGTAQKIFIATHGAIGNYQLNQFSLHYFVEDFWSHVHEI
jgi:hypothetical protein